MGCERVSKRSGSVGLNLSTFQRQRFSLQSIPWSVVSISAFFRMIRPHPSFLVGCRPECRYFLGARLAANNRRLSSEIHLYRKLV
jgi:hypothetical protein